MSNLNVGSTSVVATVPASVLSRDKQDKFTRQSKDIIEKICSFLSLNIDKREKETSVGLYNSGYIGESYKEYLEKAHVLVEQLYTAGSRFFLGGISNFPRPAEM